MHTATGSVTLGAGMDHRALPNQDRLKWIGHRQRPQHLVRGTQRPALHHRPHQTNHHSQHHHHEHRRGPTRTESTAHAGLCLVTAPSICRLRPVPRGRRWRCGSASGCARSPGDCLHLRHRWRLDLPLELKRYRLFHARLGSIQASRLHGKNRSEDTARRPRVGEELRLPLTGRGWSTNRSSTNCIKR